MITGKDVMHIGFLKKSAFKGSDAGMRYIMQAKKDEEGSIAALEVAYWPEPFNWEKTAEEKKVRTEFAFSEEGITEALEWLNRMHEEHFA